MRRRTLSALTLAAALAMSGLAAAAPASAGTGGTVTAVAMTPGGVSVDGLTGTAIAHLSVTASDTRGPIGECQLPDFESSWFHEITVGLTRTSGGPTGSAFVDLKTHSTAGDGEHWSGDWRIGSTRNGTWTVTSLWWCTGQYSYLVDPRDLGLTVTVSVTGTHAPAVSFTRVPRIAAYDAHQSMVATYRGSSGRPLVHYTIAYGWDTTCGFDGDGHTPLVTDFSGRITVALDGGIQCLYFTYPGGQPTPGATWLSKDLIRSYTYYRAVGAVLSTSTTHLSTPVTVRGTVFPVQEAVSLQRLVGRTWRTLATSRSRLSGRVEFSYAPTTRGTTILRLLARSNAFAPPTLAPTPSRVLRLAVS